jgi:hypothetical protein
MLLGPRPEGKSAGSPAAPLATAEEEAAGRRGALPFVLDNLRRERKLGEEVIAERRVK